MINEYNMSHYNLKINGKTFSVSVDSVNGDLAEVTVNGKKYEVEIDRSKPGVEIPARPVPSICEEPSSIRTTPRAKRAARSVNSPLDGTILSVHVKVGDTVKYGQTVAILEAMKMENEIQAEFSGTVTEVNVSKGDHVSIGEPVITIG